MTTKLTLGCTVQLEGVYGLLARVTAPREDMLFGYQHEAELSIGSTCKPPKGNIDKENAHLIVNKQLVLVDGKFYRVSWQGSKFAEFVYFDRELPHINLNKDQT